MEIYETPHTCKVIGRIARDTVVEALDRPVMYQSYKMIPIKMPDTLNSIGFVPLRSFEIVDKEEHVGGASRMILPLPNIEVEDGTRLLVSSLPGGSNSPGLPGTQFPWLSLKGY